MSVFTYINMSTAHVTHGDSVLLSDQDQEKCPIVYPYPEGYFIIVPQDEEDLLATLFVMRERGFSEDCIRLLFRAHKSGHSLIRLDCDAERDAELPAHGW